MEKSTKKGAINHAPTKGEHTGSPLHRSTIHGSRFAVHALLVLTTFLVFINSLPNEFIFDDVPMVQNSFNVVNSGFWDLVSSYRPLRYLTYALDYRIFGMNPWGFRLMNIFYHSLTVLSLFWMLKVFGLSKRAAFVASLIYAIHPVHTDAVSYISGRRDVLMGLFYVQSIGWFMKFYNGFSVGVDPCINPVQGKKSFVPTHLHNSTGRNTVLPLLLFFLFLFLSISSKEMGASIPLIFILYIFYKDGSKLLKKRWFYVAMMSLLLLFSFFVFFAVSRGGSALVSLEGIRFHGNSPEAHYLTASTIWLHYLKLTVFPLVLILDNAGYPLVYDWNFKVFFSVLSMFIYIWVVWRLVTTKPDLSLNPSPKGKGLDTHPLPLGKGQGERSLKNISPRSFRKGVGGKAIAFWMVFFVISLGPVLQIIPLHEIVAVHYLYVPVIAFCVIVGVLVDNYNSLDPSFKKREDKAPSLSEREGGGRVGKKGAGGEFFGRIHRFAPTILLIFLLSFFSIRTVTRNFELKDHWTVFHADEKWGPLSFRGYFTLGAEYLNMKFPDKAWEYYQKSVNTGYWDPNLLGNIVGLHIVKGNHQAAIKFYEEMIKKGEYITSPGMLNIAVLYMINGNCDKAEKLVKSFVPFANQLERIEKVKKCREYNFSQFDMNDVQDIYHKQELMKDLGLEVERKPYLEQLINSVNRESVKSEGKENKRAEGSRYLSPAQRAGKMEGPLSKKGAINRAPTSGETVGEFNDLINLVHELAVVNLQSDVPEAIKYYKMERDLYKKINKPVPEVVKKSIIALEDYKHKVLVEGKYYKLEW